MRGNSTLTLSKSEESLIKALGRFAELFYAKDEKGEILNRRGESVTVPENPQKHAFHTFAPYGEAESITM